MPPFDSLREAPVFTPRSPTLRGRITETVATLREVVLMPRDLAPFVPKKVDATDDVVVLVHGFFASAGVFRPMRRRLEAETGAKVATFSHTPGVRLERIARSLRKLVDRIPRCARIHLVGHSLGGLVSRYYVQELGGHNRIAQTISLGSPFGGTEHARLMPILVGADLVRTSPVLTRLRERAHEHDVPHTSIVGDADLMVVPSHSAIFPRGDVHVLANRGHNTLLFDPDSIDHVVRRVKLYQRSGKSAAAE